MLCPSCGTEVPELKFCENCGSPLPAAQVQESTEVAQAGQAIPGLDVAQSEQAPAQQAQPVIEPINAGSYATPQQEMGQAAFEQPSENQVPAEANSAESGAPEPPIGAGEASYQPQASSDAKAPNAAFVLVIVGLVLSAIYVTFLPGLVCSIIGLVLNMSYNKKGLDNPRKTATLVTGIIGLVVAAICIAATVFIGVVAVDVINEAEKQGVDITADNVKVTTGRDGKIVVTAEDGKSSASSQAISSSAAVSSSASSASSSDSGPSSAASASASAASGVSAGAYSDAKYHDAAGNPTLYSALELNGSDFRNLLESYGFAWDADLASWVAPSGSLYGAIDAQGALSRDKLAALPVGADGQPVVLMIAVADYDTPESALSALSEGVVVDDEHAADSVAFEVVHGSPGKKYLVAATSLDDSQALLIFTNEAISSGLFKELVGVDAGSSIDEVWDVIRKS